MTGDRNVRKFRWRMLNTPSSKQDSVPASQMSRQSHFKVGSLLRRTARLATPPNDSLLWQFVLNAKSETACKADKEPLTFNLTNKVSTGQREGMNDRNSR